MEHAVSIIPPTLQKRGGPDAREVLESAGHFCFVSCPGGISRLERFLRRGHPARNQPPAPPREESWVGTSASPPDPGGTAHSCHLSAQSEVFPDTLQYFALLYFHHGTFYHLSVLLDCTLVVCISPLEPETPEGRASVCLFWSPPTDPAPPTLSGM